ncbi:hypothetical protein [Glycomyces sp. YM15]|uniref:hypothetical protein n=1 Tax=Glycomyces sp. YM15 TaxID=2800446 RepID=UPI0019626E68|nr:hypothetical protein [Glycomyces sp. YM15]
MEPDRQPQATDPESPILVQPVPHPKWPKVITTVRVLTGLQVALVMILGNCSFGVPLLGAIAWITTQFSEDAADFAILWTWAVGFAAIFTYAYFTNRWAGRADRRARTTIIIGAVVLVSFTAVAIAVIGWVDRDLLIYVLPAATPSLFIQAIVLRCVYGREGRRWFEGEA